jgi:hypothetical protein
LLWAEFPEPGVVDKIEIPAENTPLQPAQAGFVAAGQSGAVLTARALTCNHPCCCGYSGFHFRFRHKELYKENCPNRAQYRANCVLLVITQRDGTDWSAMYD